MATTVSLTSRPWSRRSIAHDRDDLVTVDQSAIGIDRQHAVGVTVEGEPGIGPSLDDRLLEVLGVGGSAAGVDVGAVGLVVEHLHDRAEGPQHLRRRSRWRRRWRSRSPATSRLGRDPRSTRRPSRPIGSPRSSRRRPSRRPRRCGRRAAPGARAARAAPTRAPSPRSSVSLRPPGANSFTPLSSNRLWEAEMTAPAPPSVAANQATAGVGTTPNEVTCAPSDVSPATSADSTNGPDNRVSRPTTNCDPPEHREPRRDPAPSTSSRCQVEVGDTANPVSTELEHGRTMPEGGAVRSCPRLPLGVLRSLPCLLEPVLLRFLLTGVAREEAGLLQRGPQLRVDLDQGPGDAEPEGTGLAASDRRRRGSRRCCRPRSAPWPGAAR